MYLIYDDNYNYRLLNLAEMRLQLIDEIVESIKSYDQPEYDTIKPCVDTLVYLSQNFYTKPTYLIEGLKEYGWECIDIYELSNTLDLLYQEFYKIFKDMDVETIEKVRIMLNNLNKEEEE